MPDRTVDDEALDRWLLTVKRRRANHRRIESTFRNDQPGMATLALRLVLKVQEVGLRRTISLVTHVLRQRMSGIRQQ